MRKRAYAATVGAAAFAALMTCLTFCGMASLLRRYHAKL